LENTPAAYELLDNAGGDVRALLEELDEQQRLAADRSRPIEERLEAFENITESEVGDTTLVRARNIERQIGLRQIFLKFEGGNPTGTQKDRIAFAQVLDAMRRDYQTVSFATCGNYGVALALAASLAALRSLVHIPSGYRTKRLHEMERLGAEIIRVPGDYERAVEVSSALAAENEYYDANPGGANTDLQLRAYGGIAYEIYDELRDAPATVSVPVSNGTTLAGIYRGFISLYRRGKTSRIPRIVAGSSHSKNPVVAAWMRGLQTCEDLDPQRITESPVNEPLINWHAADGDAALAAIRASHGWATNASDREMVRHARLVRENEGLHVLPASTAGLLALVKQHQGEPLPADRHVVILTGRRSG
jgi:threonine synthase